MVRAFSHKGAHERRLEQKRGEAERRSMSHVISKPTLLLLLSNVIQLHKPVVPHFVLLQIFEEQTALKPVEE